MSLTLRRAGPADAQAIAELTFQAYSPWIAVIGRQPLPMTVDYAEALKASRFDLLVRRGTVVGLLQTELRDDHLLIVSVAVHPAEQGQGLGRRLLAVAEAIADEAALAEVRLFTNKRFDRNVEIYRRYGYAVEREESLSPGTVAVHMSKRLG